MLKMIRKIINILILATLLLSATYVPVLAWDSSAEVMRLNKEAPSLETFGDSGAVIWLRSNESQILADGSMDNLRASIIMIGENVPDDLRIIRFPEPSDGTLVIEEAAWYNPMTGFKEGDLPVVNEHLNGGASASTITVTDDTVGRAVVIVVRTNRANRYGVDETVNTADSLPIWEQNISVDFPEGMEIFWGGRDMRDPSETKRGSVQRYSWQIMNQLPWHGEGFVINERPLISFSSKKGVIQGLHSLKAMSDAMPSIPMPAAVKGDGARAGVKLIEWVNSSERTLEGYPQNWVRSAENIPAEGPWTRWEQTLLLNKWLTALGWKVNIWWSAKIPLSELTPASVSVFEAPILELKQRESSKSLYFKAGIPFSSGRVPSSIAALEVYRLENDEEYITKKLPSTSASANRLLLAWKLKLNELGRAEGKLDLTATGGWSDLLSGSNVPSPEVITSILTKEINFAIPGMTIEPKVVTEIENGYKLSFDVACTPGIIHGGSMLLRLPGGIPMRLGEMIGREKQYTLSFPFIIDQKVKMSMPRGYRMLQTPPLRQLGEGTKAVLKESITHWPKKAELLAESTWVVKNREVDGIFAQILREELNAALRWPVLDLPFRK